MQISRVIILVCVTTTKKVLRRFSDSRTQRFSDSRTDYKSITFVVH